MIVGMVKAYPQYVRKLDCGNVVVRTEKKEGKVAQVVVNDDVAVDGSLYTVGRRGVAGTVFVHKIAGAKAEQGAELEEVQRVAQKVIDNV
ncbi:MAG: dihydroxyacetone kinase subunit DhaK, partial [Oscillospiraceae bacterium]|nr:dihydroxyacetone kinase subunit DhaK [Clostridiales bacterium]MDY2717785.1 dihydroxyacetone kinase subunit DhaK [Oscillospiraceae bacterium]